jgi:hypothetical protein
MTPIVTIKNGQNNSEVYLSDTTQTYFTGTFLGIQIQEMHISQDVKTELYELNQTSDSTFEGNGIISTLEFNDFRSINGSTFQFNVIVNGLTETFVINSSELSMFEFKSAIASGFATLGKIQASPLWWLGPVVYVVIETIDAAIGNCNSIVTQGISACQSMGKCFEAGFCSVKCMSCSS